MSRVDARPPVYRKRIEVVRISRGGGLGSRDQGGRGVPSMAWCLASSCASSTNVAVAQAMPPLNDQPFGCLLRLLPTYSTTNVTFYFYNNNNLSYPLVFHRSIPSRLSRPRTTERSDVSNLTPCVQGIGECWPVEY